MSNLSPSKSNIDIFRPAICWLGYEHLYYKYETTMQLLAQLSYTCGSNSMCQLRRNQNLKLLRADFVP